MNSAAGALGYLIVRTTRNRIVKQASRLKNPRYVFALLFGIGYLWLTFLRPGMSASSAGKSVPGGFGSTAICLLLFSGVAITWLFSRTSSALAYLPAEIQFLLPAPLSRRQLLGYRMVRAQLIVLLNAFIWAVILRRFGVSVPVVLRFATAWAIFSVLSLHQLGAALVLAAPATGMRRLAGWTVRAALTVAVAIVLVGLAPSVSQFGSQGASEGFASIMHAFTVPPVSIVLAPFRILTGPVTATTTSGAFAAFGLILLVVAGLVVWILAMNVEFADLAVAASAKRATRIAAMRAARSGQAAAPKIGRKASRHWLPLNPLGPPLVAIAWKNTIALIRGGGARTVIILGSIVVALVAFRSMGSGTETSDRAAMALPYIMIVSMTLLTGPRLLRNDLRQDLLRLATLKTYPLSGRTLVMGEVISPTLVLTVFQVIMLLTGYLMVPGAADIVRKGGSAGLLMLLTPVALLALNGVNVVIQNGITLMFPSWVRLGSDSGGVEAMGQNLLVTFGSMLALLLSLLIPVAAAIAGGFGVSLATGSANAGLPIAAGTTIASLLLVGEIVVMINIFGRTFDRMDPTQIG